jgi:hypothetical protein
MFTPRFWKSVKFDGLLMTYQRGHKAVMNSHSVGGNSEKARYVGMDQYGNKYYEDFDAIRTSSIIIKTIINSDGLNIMTFYQYDLLTEIEFHQNGMDGYIKHMMMNLFLIATVSMIHFLKNLMDGILQYQHLIFILQEILK